MIELERLKEKREKALDAYKKASRSREDARAAYFRLDAACTEATEVYEKAAQAWRRRFLVQRND